MAKLFIFGIGGTGSRVIKSLAMLLASGVQINADEVIPIIIDPDEDNGDLERTLEILAKYQAVRKELSFESNNFFRTKITTLNEINDDAKERGLEPNFHFELKNVQNLRFKEYIGIEDLSQANDALIHALFSSDNLESSMNIGFKGNPNIGSVVLNQIKDTDEFRNFVSNFGKDDRIFIISSIFGGTGAAGFPLLVKNIRQAKEADNQEFLKNSKIGAVCILPYFGVVPDRNSKINKTTFISKAKSALEYYARNLSGNKSLNALYYIGDTVTKDYVNNEGSKKQKNDAHFVELAAALSIVDFMGIEDKLLQTKDRKTINPHYKEFGVKDGRSPLSFSKLGLKTRNSISKPLAQMMFFSLYLQKQKDKSVETQPWSIRGDIKLTNTFFHDIFYDEYFKVFVSHFDDWIEELARNKISFKPFDLPLNKDHIFKLLIDVHVKTVFSFKKNFAYFDHRLNKAEKIFTKDNRERKFINMFYNATETIFDKRFNLKKES